MLSSNRAGVHKKESRCLRGSVPRTRAADYACRLCWKLLISAFLLVCFAKQSPAQSPAAISLSRAYELLPDGTTSPILSLNQPITVAMSYGVPTCPLCGLNYPPYYVPQTIAVHVDAPGASQTSFVGTDTCGQIGPGTSFPSSGGGQLSDLGGYAPLFSAYYWYSTPGLKTVTYKVYLCNGATESSTVEVQKSVSFGVGDYLEDPVSSLLNGPTVTTNPNTLADGFGQAVQGVAADGVTEAVVAMPAANAGDQITVTVLNDQGGQSTNSGQDGGLGNVGGSSFSQSQITVTAQNVSYNEDTEYEAFAIYQAPIDFVRGSPSTGYMSGTCGNITTTDDQLACRSVSLQIQDVTAGTSAVTLPVTIVRPVVVLIHGLWDNYKAWQSFSPLYTIDSSGAGHPDPAMTTPRWAIQTVDYSSPFPLSVSQIYPAYLGNPATTTIPSNALGFQYNAVGVQSQVLQFIRTFKAGSNPIGYPVAAVQADIVAHSMGGDIARTMALQAGFLDNETLGEGYVHKLITIDTPHLGTPVATQLLASPNACVASLLASRSKMAINEISLPNGTPIFGAVGDLQGILQSNGATQADSPALGNIAGLGSHPLPTAFIGAEADSSNFAGLGVTSSFAADYIRVFCFVSPLASDLTPSNWQPSVFNGMPNDAIVPLDSQFDGSQNGYTISGFIHSPGTEDLGFDGPTVLDSGAVPDEVIYMLNTPVTQFTSIGP